MSDQKPDVQTIFNEALKRKSAEEVAAYLDVACDLEANLRAQVEALLRAHQEAGNFLGGQPSEAVTEAPTVDHAGASDDWHSAPNPSDLTKHFPHLEVLELLGQGGMGAVYKARQPKLDRVVALKILPPKFGRDPTFAERFVREAQAMARLDHPNIVTVHDFGQTGELCFILMEYVDGVNLRESLNTGQLAPEQALAIVPQICDALQFAHDEGIVHRDIKPENVLLDKRGRIKIADFGLAKLVGTSAPNVRLTISHQVMGTPHYMAPEQINDPLRVDHRADIYSLGVVFYEMLTGEAPMGRFDPPSKKVDLDVRLDEVVLRALAEEPERRYQQASEVKTDMEAIPKLPQQPPLRGSLTDDPHTEEARKQVQWPATGLIVLGVFATVFWGVFPFATMWLQETVLQRSISQIHYFRLIATLSVPIASSLTLTFGGISMVRLRSLRWAIAVSVLALLPIPAGPLWLLSLPLGIWSLIVLNQPSVKQGFKTSS